MNLSRRGFLKSLLATSALAPIAPALVEAVAPDTGWVELETLFEKLAASRIKPINGYYTLICNPRMVEDLRMFGRAFYDQDGNHIPAENVCEWEFGHLDDGIRWPIEEEPIAYKHIEPLEFNDDYLRELEEGGPFLKRRRVTREELMTEGFTREMV